MVGETTQETETVEGAVIVEETTVERPVEVTAGPITEENVAPK